MTNTFEEAYQKVQESKRMYDNSTTKEQENAARKLYHEVGDKIEELGQDACSIYRQYQISRDSGNERLNLYDVIWENSVENFVRIMRENGVEEFTFSSTWSSAIEIAWLFQKNGCQLEGLIEINSQYKQPFKDEYERVPAYLFRV